MSGGAAPFHRDVAGGPAEVRALWIEAADGARLRVALWPAGGRGTVAMFPGRTEFCEKYADAAAHLAARGFASAAIDWRGQGLTARAGRHRMLGHVEDFSEFQRDVDAFVTLLDTQGMPRPFHLLAHSMGGAIGLRALLRRLPFANAVFSAPMWGLPLVPHQRLAAWALANAGGLLGLSGSAVPRSGKVADPASAPFERNLLTTDPAMFVWMKRQIAVHPELALGGPTVGWLRSALGEMRALAALPSPATPCLALLGTEEAIVDPAAVRDRMDRWPGGRLEIVADARHEVLMEGDTRRARLFDEVAARFAAETDTPHT